MIRSRRNSIGAFLDADGRESGSLTPTGKKRWIALLEIKTGGAALVADHVNTYLDIPAPRVAAATSMRRAVETAGFKSGQADRRTPIAPKGATGSTPEAPCCSGQLDPAAGGRLSDRAGGCPWP